eukprot:CAMPEP_0175055590 /NCGR_PEP_ID=MMETSP0052_2-20121109/10174_1 /TAXON_ID=51329 ORGANISM="Polytomella parva, Strain SAG 63-3" /NCGR_SAMPLE_ID=MMETSP0052_2 /ASSEMBLY_ACC=CAM_ASM_000194 /LENGTH=45 /DNA_ID= /DNA_START= /DNA_END= /DNA_ORIENTATION=
MGLLSIGLAPGYRTRVRTPLQIFGKLQLVLLEEKSVPNALNEPEV